MRIADNEYQVVEVYDLSVTVPDSFVTNDNKTCKGHGEAKFYMGSKEHMREFYTGNPLSDGFEVTCIVLREDLLQYMQTIQHEYLHPSITYRGQRKRSNMSRLWHQRNVMLHGLPDVMEFQISDQKQIEGSRGYVKSISRKKDCAYEIIRNIALPFVSYVSVMKLQQEETGKIYFYWRLFTDFSQMAEQQFMAKNYGKRKAMKSRRSRDGQEKYRQGLYTEFRHCPFSKIDDARLLVASHIKPWAVCNREEKVDVSNGFLLSPLFDKLFDKGFITFGDDGSLIISEWLSAANQNRIDFTYDTNDLLLTPKRKAYLKFHRENVFKS